MATCTSKTEAHFKVGVHFHVSLAYFPSWKSWLKVQMILHANTALNVIIAYSQKVLKIKVLIKSLIEEAKHKIHGP